MKGGTIRRQLLWKLTRPWNSLRDSHSSHNAYCHELKNSNEKLSTETGQAQMTLLVLFRVRYRVGKFDDIKYPFSWAVSHGVCW